MIVLKNLQRTVMTLSREYYKKEVFKSVHQLNVVRTTSTTQPLLQEKQEYV